MKNYKNIKNKTRNLKKIGKGWIELSGTMMRLLQMCQDLGYVFTVDNKEGDLIFHIWSVDEDHPEGYWFHETIVKPDSYSDEHDAVIKLLGFGIQGVLAAQFHPGHEDFDRIEGPEYYTWCYIEEYINTHDGRLN